MRLPENDPGVAPRAPHAAAAWAALALAILSAGCSITARRWPGPLESVVTPLGPGAGEIIARGPEEVLVARHADPVHVRPAGSNGGFPLTFYNKRMRMNSGSAIAVAAGGRAEVFWPSGTSLVLSDETVGLIGSPSRGEPIFLFGLTDHATLHLVPGDEVQLMGGAILTGESGPYVLDRRYRDILRVHNQSKGPLRIAYRNDIFELGPGHSVDLPLLEVGSVPIDDVGFEPIAARGFTAAVRGDAEATEVAGGLRLRASEAAEVDALGLRFHLQPGEEVVLDGLAPRTIPNLIPE